MTMTRYNQESALLRGKQQQNPQSVRRALPLAWASDPPRPNSRLVARSGTPRRLTPTACATIDRAHKSTAFFDNLRRIDCQGAGSDG